MADDDDIDLFGHGGKGAVDLELEDIGPARKPAPPVAPLPGLEDPLPPAAPSSAAARPRPSPQGRPGSNAQDGAKPSAMPPSRLAGFGDPGETLGQAMAYAVRVYSRQRVIREMRTLRRRKLAEQRAALDEAHAALGRALADASPRAAAPALAAAFAAADARAKELNEAVGAREATRSQAGREQQLAAARMESASAGLDPFEREEERGRADLARAESDLVEARAEVERLDAEFRDAVAQGRTDADQMARADRAIDAARQRLTDATRRHRDTLMRLGELRRRVILQTGRLAEAAASVDAARVRLRREQTAQQRKEAEAADRLRDAWIALGTLAADTGRGAGLAGDPAARVERARQQLSTLRLDIEDLGRADGSIDAEAVQRGRRALAGVSAVFSLLVIALLVFG